MFGVAKQRVTGGIKRRGVVAMLQPLINTEFGAVKAYRNWIGKGPFVWPV